MPAGSEASEVLRRLPGVLRGARARIEAGAWRGELCEAKTGEVVTAGVRVPPSRHTWPRTSSSETANRHARLVAAHRRRPPGGAPRSPLDRAVA